MANVLDIRRRIRSVKSTQQITRAMKFVAAAKLRKAQERMFLARPYAGRMIKVISSLAARVETISHPLLETREDKKVELVLITGDNGLCGAFNSNIIRMAVDFLEKQKDVQKDMQLNLIGKKGRDFFRRRQYQIRTETINLATGITFAQAKVLADSIIECYSGGAVDSVYLLYNEFKSVMQQRILVEKILPIQRLPQEEKGSILTEYIYEQDPAQILSTLLPQHVITQVYHALIESAAAEQAARMTSMEAATKNAGEMIDHLTLTMNRARQASITKELIEIVSGANALQ